VFAACFPMHDRCAEIKKKYTCHVKILGARMVACSTFHIVGPQILGDTIQNFVARGNWDPEILHP